MTLAVLGFSLPIFVVAYLLIYGLAMTLDVLPIQGYQPLAGGIGPWAAHLVLPSLTLGFSFMALVARITRASVLEVLSQDYMRTARAKGLGSRQLLLDHALANAAVPIVTIIGVGVALLLGGVVVTESVFAIPGIGRLVVDAILYARLPGDSGCTPGILRALRRAQFDHRFAVRRARPPHPLLRWSLVTDVIKQARLADQADDTGPCPAGRAAPLSRWWQSEPLCSPSCWRSLSVHPGLRHTIPRT